MILIVRGCIRWKANDRRGLIDSIGIQIRPIGNIMLDTWKVTFTLNSYMTKWTPFLWTINYGPYLGCITWELMRNFKNNQWIQSLTFTSNWGCNWDQTRFSGLNFVSKWPALSCNILWTITWIQGRTKRIFLDETEIVFGLVWSRARFTIDIFTFGTMSFNFFKGWILVNFDKTKIFFEGIFISTYQEKNSSKRSYTILEKLFCECQWD